MRTTLSGSDVAFLSGDLLRACGALRRAQPGCRPGRQPLHTYYLGAHEFHENVTAELGRAALAAMDRWAPDAAAFSSALGLPGSTDDASGLALAQAVHDRVRAKLASEPVEDLRIDFEDGYGVRADSEEDETALEVARCLAAGVASGTLPQGIGVRLKPLNESLHVRSLRTLDLLLTHLGEHTGGDLPEDFVVTLPKVAVPEQVQVVSRVLDELENRLGIRAGTVKISIMIETTEALFDEAGGVGLPGLVRAAEGRCIAAHIGTYDYTASCNLAAPYQVMDHPVCDFAKHLIQVTLGGRALHLTDGATHLVPEGPHRGRRLSAKQKSENAQHVQRAWRTAHAQVRHSMASGYYQGWDLHPGSLPVRYGAAFGFFLEHLDSAAARMSSFLESARAVTQAGGVFDDAATGQGLLAYFTRARLSGAITSEELARAGLSETDLDVSEFAALLKKRADGDDC